MSRNILFGFPARLLGFPQAPGRPPARPTEHAFRRGFALPYGRFLLHIRAGEGRRILRR